MATKYKDGVFTWSPGRNLRRMSLTFGGGDTPTYSVGSEDIVGLPKLLVLSSLRGSLRESEMRRLRGQQELTAEEGGAGTFIIDLDKLAQYGTSGIGEVWRKPTPPAPPPTKLTRHNTRQQTIADEHHKDYAGVVLTYGRDHITTPFDLVEPLNASHYDESTGQLQYVHECLEVGPDGQWTGDAPLENIEDASECARVGRPRQFYKDLYKEGHQQKLPRLLEFPASNATGLANPFARMPAAAWFGDVY